ncbi:FYN-binding protein 1 isoform X3 [Octopus sinensis]|uniref:FYN-binding protein 1 isoform X3 n=1 Tax=Octopus sinensis TaxID=2607531 RepID=A0A7E6F213_9MOLL|nr:FYN-binding protein 1 isoform X3 [Octopus sinensis]
MRKGQGNVTVSALKARFDAPLSNKTEINTTRKVADRNSKFKPHTTTDKITNTTSTTKPSLKTLESKNVSTIDRKNVSTLDRKSISSLEQKSLLKQEESGKKLLNNKVESSCDTPNSNSVINGGSSSESGSRLSITTNKINIPAAFACETTNTTSSKQLHARKSPYQTSRQNSQQSNHENSTESPQTKVNASPKHVVLDKGTAMRDPEEIKSLGGSLIKKRTELLTQAIHGNTGTKSKVSAPPTPERSDSLPKGFELNNKDVIIRKRDNKKFQLINKSKLQTVQKCPSKPRKLESNEIIFLLRQYEKAVEELTKSNDTSQGQERCSLIPDMTEEEEEIEDSTSSQSSSTTGYRPIPPPPRKPVASSTSSDQTYDDIGNTPRVDESDDAYDDLTDFQENEKKREKEQKERRDKEEKKRKEKEEKERRKQEKEEKKMRAKLKMDGTEQVLSEGTYTGEVFKPGKLDLAIKKGDRINILRMHNNPAGKWLAKSEDGRLGYVDSQFVEICASNIKNVMGIGHSQTQSSECPARYGWYSLCYGFCYTPGDEDVSADDIYEEIPKV